MVGPIHIGKNVKLDIRTYIGPNTVINEGCYTEPNTYIEGVETGTYERWQGVPGEVVGRMQVRSILVMQVRS